MRKIKRELIELERKLDYFQRKTNSLNFELMDKNLKINSIVPEKMVICKQRNKTYVKFKNGSVVTVKLAKGEKFSAETALAYCVMKQAISNECVNKVLKNVKILKVGEDIRKKL